MDYKKVLKLHFVNRLSIVRLPKVAVTAEKHPLA